MLAYTAVDSLRAISRDFDLNWQPSVSDNNAASRHDWRSALRVRRPQGRHTLGAMLTVLAFGTASWLR